MSLINSSKDQDYCDSSTNTDVNETRILGAKALIKKLSDGCTELGSLIKNLQKVTDAIIELAYYQGGENDVDCPIPTRLKIRKLGSVENVLVLTCDLPVRKSKDYSNIIGEFSLTVLFQSVYFAFVLPGLP